MFNVIRFAAAVARANKAGQTTTQPATPAAADPTVSQAKLFATEYARDTAREMLDAIKENARGSEKVTKIALAVSMPHQVGYLLGLAPLQWDTLNHILESVTLIGLSVGVPVAVDYLILMCVRTIASRAAATVSKVTAGVAMLFPIGLSGSVNFLAPAPMLIRILAAAAVVLIPISQAVRAMNRPDFRKVDKMEHDVAEQIAPTAAPKRATPKASKRSGEKATKFATANPNVKAGDLVRLYGVTPYTAKKILAGLAPVKTPKEPNNIPTSPAPAGMQLAGSFRP